LKIEIQVRTQKQHHSLYNQVGCLLLAQNHFKKFELRLLRWFNRLYCQSLQNN